MNAHIRPFCFEGRPGPLELLLGVFSGEAAASKVEEEAGAQIAVGAGSECFVDGAHKRRAVAGTGEVDGNLGVDGAGEEDVSSSMIWVTKQMLLVGKPFCHRRINSPRRFSRQGSRRRVRFRPGRLVPARRVVRA
jgi:hypothetical protein